MPPQGEMVAVSQSLTSGHPTVSLQTSVEQGCSGDREFGTFDVVKYPILQHEAVLITGRIEGAPRDIARIVALATANSTSQAVRITVTLEIASKPAAKR